MDLDDDFKIKWIITKDGNQLLAIEKLRNELQMTQFIIFTKEEYINPLIDVFNQMDCECISTYEAYLEKLETNSNFIYFIDYLEFLELEYVNNFEYLIGLGITIDKEFYTELSNFRGTLYNVISRNKMNELKCFAEMMEYEANDISVDYFSNSELSLYNKFSNEEAVLKSISSSTANYASNEYFQPFQLHMLNINLTYTVEQCILRKFPLFEHLISDLKLNNYTFPSDLNEDTLNSIIICIAADKVISEELQNTQEFYFISHNEDEDFLSYDTMDEIAFQEIYPSYPKFLLHDDKVFRVYKKCSKCAYYRCACKFCKASLKITANSIRTINENHINSCHSHLNKIQSNSIFLENIRKIAKQKKDEGLTIEETFFELISNPDFTSIMITKNDIKDIFASPEVHSDIFQSPYDVLADKSFLRVHQLIPEQILVFATDDMIEYQDKTDVILVDGTFRIAPKGFKQVLTIMGYSTKLTSYFPLFYVFLPSKKQEVYKRLFTILQNMFNFETIKYAFSDFETGLINVLSSVMHSEHYSKVHGCRFHFAQAILRKFKKKCPQATETQKGIINYFLKFPFLTKVQRDDIRGYLNNYDHGIDEFINYFYNTWEKKISPDFWSIENKCQLPFYTNNGIEGYHSQLSSRIQVSNPHIETTLHALKKYSNYVFAKLKLEGKNIKTKANVDIPCQSDVIVGIKEYLSNNFIIKN